NSGLPRSGLTQLARAAATLAPALLSANWIRSPGSRPAYPCDSCESCEGWHDEAQSISRQPFWRTGATSKGPWHRSACGCLIQIPVLLGVGPGGRVPPRFRLGASSKHRVGRGGTFSSHLEGNPSRPTLNGGY